MNYHNITYPDMNNGDGLRVALWLSGCSHYCKGCQNIQTWNPNSGIPFDEEAEEELFRELNKDYISGLTLSGGDPLHENNLKDVLQLINKFKNLHPNKTIWLYTGYTFEEIKNEIDAWHQDEFILNQIINSVDVVVDGKYIEELRDITLEWRGSSNQNIWKKVDGEWVKTT